MAAKKQSEQVKLYAVIVLCVIALIMAYFRFGRKKPGARAAGASPGPAPDLFEVPALNLDEYRLGLAEETAAREPFRPVARDIFAPSKKASGQSPAGGGEMGKGQKDRPKLRGVIRAGQRRMAHINDQVLGVGETIGPYTLIRIGESSAVLRLGEDTVILTIAKGPPLSE